MSKYSDVAIRAIDLIRSGAKVSAQEAWDAAACELFAGKEDAQKKSCPKGAFLGLCEEGLVCGIPPGDYTSSKDNKDYAIDAVKRLRNDASLGLCRPTELWHIVMNGREKRHNSQMDVVLSLWSKKLIAPSPIG